MRNNKILVDTNILIYAWDTRDLVKQRRAIEIFEKFRSHLHLSVQNLSEFSAVMIRHSCDLDWLQRTVQLMQNVMTIMELSESDIQSAIQAVKQYKMSYWDAQIWAVARSNGIRTIFTEDGPIGQTIEEVTYMNPLS